MTINQLIQLFKNIGDAHYFIKTTEFGDAPSKVDANIDEEIYPAFYQVLDNTTNLTNTVERTFTITICDLVHTDKSNLNEVLSDTEQTLSDIIKILRQESDYYDVIGDPQITPFKDKYGDAVAGHEASITIETLYNSGFCDIPSDVFGYPGTTGTNGLPFLPAFDCDDLTDCQVIQAIQLDITALENAGYIDSSALTPYLTIASAASTYQPIGNYGTLQQVLAIGNITGAYDIELSNNQNIISNDTQSTIGFLTGTTVNLNTYDIGGNYSDVTLNKTSLVLSNSDGVNTNTFTLTSTTNVTDKSFEATSLIKTGGTSTQFLKADGSVDSSTYLTSASLIGYVPYTGASVDLNLGNYNLYGNNVFLKSTTTVSAGGTTILTVNSTAYQYLTGSNTQTYQLPDATTLPISLIFYFNNNSSSALTIVNAASTTIYVVPAGGVINIECTNNSTLAGSWDGHPRAPMTVTWGSGVTGLVMNSVLSTSATISAGASSSTSPVFIPQRGSLTTGYGGDSTNLYGIIGGVNKFSLSATLLSTTNNVNIGNAVTTNQRLVRFGQDSAIIDIGSWPANTAYSAIYLGAATPGTNNYALLSQGTNIQLNGSSSFSLRVNNVPIIWTTGSRRIDFTPSLDSGGSTLPFSFITPLNANQTASTASPDFLLQLTTKQWATGTLATQKFFEVTAPTISFVGTSTATNVYTMYVSAPVAGSNASITNSFGFGTNGNIQAPKIQSASGNFTIESVSGNTLFRSYGNQVGLIGINTSSFTPVARSSGAGSIFTFIPPANTNQTASAEINGFAYVAGTQQWATGNITTQREFYIASRTYSFVGVSQIINAFGMYVEAPTAGTNATITNKYALGLAGNMLLATNNSGIFGNDSTGACRQLLDFAGDNIRIIGVPGTTDIYLTPGTAGLGIIVKGNKGSVGINQGTPTAFLDLPASVAGRATLRIRTGVAPSSPNDGDIWQDGTDIKIRIGGVTKTFVLI